MIRTSPPRKLSVVKLSADCERTKKVNIEWSKFFKNSKAYILSRVNSNIFPKKWFNPPEADVITLSNRAYMYRIICAICLGLLAQVSLALQFLVLANATWPLDKWLLSSYNAVLKMFNYESLILACGCVSGYGLVMSKLYEQRTPYCRNRSELLFFNAFRKLQLLLAQMIFVLLNFYIFADYFFKRNENFGTFQYASSTVAVVVSYNFWNLYAFRALKIDFEVMRRMSRFEQLRRILQPSARAYTQVLRPLIWCTVLYGVTAIDPQSSFTFPALTGVYRTYLMISLCEHAVYTQHRLMEFALSQHMEISSGPSLVEALDTKDESSWILKNAVRDFLSFSETEARYHPVFHDMPNQSTYSFLMGITGRSLYILSKFRQNLRTAYESPSKLMTKQLIERSLWIYNSENILKRLHNRDGFVVSITTAPTLCSCPLGPIQPSVESVYKVRGSFAISYGKKFLNEVLAHCKIIHLWHFLFCSTYGSKVRYMLQDFRLMQNIFISLSNVFIAAHKYEKIQFIKLGFAPVVRELIDIIDVLEIVPVQKHSLYGLDEKSFRKLKSLKMHAKYGLVSLLQCYQDSLSTFVPEDIKENINRLVQLYEWPIQI